MTVGLQLEGIRKNFGDTVAIESFDLEVGEGEFVSLLGPSGCGKSTTLMIVAGFETVTAGTVTLRGRRVDNLSPEQRRIGMMFQSYALFPHMTVGANVEYGLRMRGIAKSERKARAALALERVKMAAFGDRLPRTLSGGQQQRVALARALITEPDILLLDEPFSALDRQLREELQHEVRLLQQSLGITTIFVTHDQEEALLMSDRVVVMNSGRIEQCAAPSVLYETPATSFVSRFIGRGTLLEADVVREEESVVALRCLQQTISVNKPGFWDPISRVQVFFRPESAEIVATGCKTQAGLRFDAQLVTTYFHGAKSLAEVIIKGTGERSFVDCSSQRRGFDFRSGDNITVSVPADRLHIVPRTDLS